MVANRLEYTFLSRNLASLHPLSLALFMQKSVQCFHHDRICHVQKDKPEIQYAAVPAGKISGLSS